MAQPRGSDRSAGGNGGAYEDFSDEISAVAHRMRDALVPSVMVLLVALPHYVQLVARSTNDALDVGELARRFGGGGTPRSGRHADGDRSETAHRQVLDLLPQLIRPIMRVSEMMSQGVKTISRPMRPCARRPSPCVVTGMKGIRLSMKPANWWGC